MAIYETFENIFCYDDEKEEQATETQQLIRQHTSATSDSGANTTYSALSGLVGNYSALSGFVVNYSTISADYSTLRQSDESDCIEMDDVMTRALCQDIGNTGGYQDHGSTGGYQDTGHIIGLPSATAGDINASSLTELKTICEDAESG